MFNLSKNIEEKYRKQNLSNNKIDNNIDNKLDNQLTKPNLSKSYIEVDKINWHLIPKKTYIRYILINNNDLKHGGLISDIIKDNSSYKFILYTKIGTYWKSWQVKFENIIKLFKLDKTDNKDKLDIQDVNKTPQIQQTPQIQHIPQIQQTPQIQPTPQIQQIQHIPQSNYNNLLACQTIPLQLPLSVIQNTDNNPYKTEIELLNKKIENLEITQQRLESDIKKIINIISKLTN